MDSFEFTKIAGAVLFTLLLLTASRIGVDAVYLSDDVQPPVYLVAGTPAKAPPANGTKAQAAQTASTSSQTSSSNKKMTSSSSSSSEDSVISSTVTKAFPKANPAKGKTIASGICTACHDISSARKIHFGPPLWGVFGRKKASWPGFSYTSALKSKGGTWTAQDLNTFLTKPSRFAPGTRMSFPGFDNAQRRHDVIAWLSTLGAIEASPPKGKKRKGESTTTSKPSLKTDHPAAIPLKPSDKKTMKTKPPHTSSLPAISPMKDMRMKNMPMKNMPMKNMPMKPMSMKDMKTKPPHTPSKSLIESKKSLSDGPGVSGKQGGGKMENAKPAIVKDKGSPKVKDKGSPKVKDKGNAEIKDKSTAAPENHKEENKENHKDTSDSKEQADIATGQRLAQRRCSLCHDFSKGGKKKQGPPLWGIVGRKKASWSGFSYSKSLKQKGGIWTVKELDAFLEKPSRVIPRTKMIFPGLKQASQRQNLIAWLATLADKPPTAPDPNIADAQ